MTLWSSIITVVVFSFVVIVCRRGGSECEVRDTVPDRRRQAALRTSIPWTWLQGMTSPSTVSDAFLATRLYGAFFFYRYCISRSVG